VEGVTDGENEGDDCDEVICARWGGSGGEWTQWGWRNEDGSRNCSQSYNCIMPVIYTVLLCV